MESRLFPVIIEQDEDGFFAECPSLQGCHAQGKTYEETFDNIRDAIHLHLEDRKSRGEPIPSARNVSILTLEVSA